jgi:sulfur-carrier protein adenylyltransferase/sulfurtransferase
MTQVIPFTQISPEIFKKLLDSWEYFLIDIRTEWEVRTYGEIAWTKGRYDIYEHDFPERVLKLPRDQKYLIYCWHWNRSQAAVDWMKSEGFKWVCDLEGGIDKWSF